MLLPEGWRLPFYHLHNVAKVHHFLSQSDGERLLHVFISSRLDYCNSLLSGCPEQAVKQSTACPECCCSVADYNQEIDHISPVLASPCII